MSGERIVALLGRPDEPTDGVADYCAFLGEAMRARSYEFETVRVPWLEKGWGPALDDLRKKAAAWRGGWVLFQYTNLAWSRRAFPFHAPRVLAVLRRAGVRCGVVFHDFATLPGSRMIDRARQWCQSGVLKKLYAQADRAIFTVSIDKIPWVPRDSSKAVFIPVGANIPEPSSRTTPGEGGKKTVAVFSVTGGPHIAPEVTDIGAAVKQARKVAGPIRVTVVGRGSLDAEPALRAEFSGTDIEVDVLGLLSAEEMTNTLSRADVLLFVRGQISSRRGSAIAGIACGLPIVCYAGPETTWPVTEAGIVAVPLRDRQALSAALERVLADDVLRASLAERSRTAEERYFSWRAIADQFTSVLQGPLNLGSHEVAAPGPVVAPKI